jgi:hypothetical protein
LADHLGRRFPEAKADLATAMLQRMRGLAVPGGTLAAVTPQNWLFLGSSKRLRERLLSETSLSVVAVLGEHGFDSAAAAGAFTALVVVTEARPDDATGFAGVDANEGADPAAKAEVLREGEVRVLGQVGQRGNPDATIKLQESTGLPLVGKYADSWQGLVTGDNQRFTVKLWEVSERNKTWKYFISSPDETGLYKGRDTYVRWEQSKGALHRNSGAHNFPPTHALGHKGVLVSQGRSVRAALYTGEVFNDGSVPIIPRDELNLLPLWLFISDPGFTDIFRTVNRKLIMGCGYFLKVPFDVAHWQRVAAEKYPNGLPEPYSDDPTQWLFHGHPRYAEPGTELHVALARLAGYRWPAETDTTMRLSAEARARIAEAATLPPADADGLLPLSPLLGERGLADRLRTWCAAAWGSAWTADTEAALIATTCERFKDKPPKTPTLDAWLRTHAARQHAKLFHDRPFLWWITDGRADGFMAVVHYHRLTRDALSRLAFHVLGDWLTRLGDDPRAEAARILQKKLEQIIEGEAPYDIFVRWKPLHEQPLGWEPDLDDGVRLNIRPFVKAGVLAHVPNVKYGVDRGKDLPSAPWYGVFKGERRNDHHTTLAEKRAARADAGRS